MRTTFAKFLGRLFGQDQSLSVEAFNSRLLKERALADRNGHEFSLLVFHFSDPRQADACLRPMTRGIRFSDEIGFLAAHKIGVILPQTSRGGARIVADRIESRIRDEGRIQRREVFVYPQNGARMLDSEKPQQSHTEARAPIGRAANLGQIDCEDLDELLLAPVPAWKRAIDFAAAALLLVGLSPLLLLVAAWIKICSPNGSVLFAQERVGRNGRLFRMWKFRTMKPDSGKELHSYHLRVLMKADKPLTKLDDLGDPRLLPLAVLVRRTGLDELPQLCNVLRGDMSLVGPRPCLSYEAQDYQQWQRRRFDTLPGLTGLWQVTGKNRMTFTEMMRRDVSYVSGRSLWLDLKILWKTPGAVFSQLFPVDRLSRPWYIKR